MTRPLHRGLSVAQLRLFLGLLFLALALPTAVLIVQTRRQMQWEAFHQYQTLADELATRIDSELQRLIATEEARTYADYHFAVVAGNPNVSNFVQRSPLAQYPVASEIPGLLGYFEIDVSGDFSTPLLPEELSDPTRWGLDAAELVQRRALRDNLLDILSRNQLVERHRDRDDRAPDGVALDDLAPDHVGSRDETQLRREVAQTTIAEPLVEEKADAGKLASTATSSFMSSNQAAFDQLNTPANAKLRAKRNDLGRIEDLPIDKSYDGRYAEQEGRAQRAHLQDEAQVRASRKEQSAVPELPQATRGPDGNEELARVRIFESEVDPFEFALLDSGHGVLFRKVWRDGRRTIQGAIVAQEPFLERAIVAPFAATALAQMSDLVIAWDGDVLKQLRGAGDYEVDATADLAGDLLHQVRLSAPLGEFQLLWTINRLPAGAGAKIVGWSSVVLFGVLTLGFFALYRLGLRQITLARQQQDFVSAVSHELKTPLTSIRMYAEMLREGWAAEDKKRGYYDFIHDESERLSRLIANVLQLARLERNELRLELKPVAVSVLMNMLRSKVHTQIEGAGFACEYVLDPACAQRELEVDVDAFIQIVINLVDNAIKFSSGAERRAIEIAASLRGAQSVVWSVRDYGPGVPKAQMRKIFQLFYRAGPELTRETVGTGIGLALVRQLARAIHGEVDVINREPGAEFQLTLRCGP